MYRSQDFELLHPIAQEQDLAQLRRRLAEEMEACILRNQEVRNSAE